MFFWSCVYYISNGQISSVFTEVCVFIAFICRSSVAQAASLYPSEGSDWLCYEGLI